MPQPVTTTDLFLQEVVGLLTEIRGLLQDGQPAAKKAPAKPAAAKKTAAPAGRRAKATK